MKKFYSNYKFLILMILPVMGIIFSVFFLLFSTGSGIYVGISILFLSLLTIIILAIVEPVLYIINSKAITTIGIFKRCDIFWKQVKCIDVKYDPFFDLLFIKDYVLVLDNRSNCPHRFLRIVKSGKTQVLINQYSLIHHIKINQN